MSGALLAADLCMHARNDLGLTLTAAFATAPLPQGTMGSKASHTHRIDDTVGWFFTDGDAGCLVHRAGVGVEVFRR